MKYAIQSSSGQWWTGTCWGVIQARELYASIDALPEEVPDCNGPGSLECRLWVNSKRNPLDAGYDLGRGSQYEILASVYEVI